MENEKQNQSDVMHHVMEDSSIIAVVGFSRRRSRAGYYVPAYLKEVGYRIIPVNPYLDQALGQKAYPSLKSIPEPVDLVLLFQRSEKVPSFVDEAIEIQAKSIWLQLGIYHDAAAKKARKAGLNVVMDACMLVEHRAWIRRRS